jgi:hypothetical protein
MVTTGAMYSEWSDQSMKRDDERGRRQHYLASAAFIALAAVGEISPCQCCASGLLSRPRDHSAILSLPNSINNQVEAGSQMRKAKAV